MPTPPHTRLRLVKPVRPRRMCAACDIPLVGQPAHHTLCPTCYCWTRLGAAVRTASRWFAEEPRP